MGTSFTNVTIYRLPTIPNLTTISVNFHKPRDRPCKIHTNHTRPSGNLRKVSPVLITDFINRSKKFKSVTDIMIGRIIRIIIYNNINPIWGKRRGRGGQQPP